MAALCEGRTGPVIMNPEDDTSKRVHDPMNS